jgi:hypothetical protein
MTYQHHQHYSLSPSTTTTHHHHHQQQQALRHRRCECNFTQPQSSWATTTYFFDTTNCLWYDAFQAGRGGDFDDDDGNNATPSLHCGK